ncbi:MAG: twin-arginine translocase subunit TatC [Bacteroidales bacterium]|nr:twin-arginine translocase subunit TatC [Bacteroidales bacterium]
MTFWEHLEEARWSIVRMLAAWAICLVPSFLFLPWIFDHLILLPARSAGYDLINIQVASQFTTHLSMSVYLSLLLAAPYMLYEVWKFVRPALYPAEKKGMQKGFLLGGFLFYLGCAVGCLVVFPLTFRFLVGYELSPSITNSINLSSYTSLFNAVTFLFGLSFELPILLWILSLGGLVHKDCLRSHRRHAIVALLILAAIITPTGDPVTLSVVFFPLYLLYEFSIWLVKK